MKEVDNRPICPVCGKIHNHTYDYCYDWLRNYNISEIMSGCHFCGQSLIFAFRKDRVCCSNPECPSWAVRKNGDVYYENRLIFSVYWPLKSVLVHTGIPTEDGSGQEKVTTFYKKLLKSIIKQKDKNRSNLYKGLRFRSIE